MKNAFFESLIRFVLPILDKLQAYMTENLIYNSILAIIIFLFIVWLVHRIENHSAQDVIYRNFPFFEKAVNSFQFKIDNLTSRIESLEKRIKTIEDKMH